MTKLWIRIGILTFFGMTLAVSSLSAFRPEEMYKDQVAVLMYHHVSDTTEGPGTISTSLLRDQLSFLQSQSYQFITLNDFKDYMEGAPVPPNAVLVTFDDGYESFYTDAYPILKDLQVPAVSFVITGTIADPKNGTTPFMSKEELTALAGEKGLIDLECHSDSLHEKQNGKAFMTHKLIRNGRQESGTEYVSRITEDAKACSSKIAEISPDNGRVLAYPFGIYNREAVAALKEGGIQYAFTVMPKIVTRNSDPMRLPRINAGSPYVQPETLHNMIMRRITNVGRAHESVPLRETVEQIGGELYRDKADGNAGILFNGEQYKLSSDRGSVTKVSDQSVYPLTKPLFIKRNRSYIDLQDLQRILGVSIRFDESTKTFTTASPAESDTDSESYKTTP
jgi:poly-beta-1,6-N-acetyl-D-glucosamine N-deacetylase